ncbi:mandelate racemase/muconate lactonizing enzyme family protein [Streptomyces sp. NPDC006365]|uniref:mandelate racemase/muconate lactonizing enzyme family protein n=1 Tax=Streptomyces sp. NPDC006365 TaxID=3364744 RepID=UPI0036ACF574
MRITALETVRSEVQPNVCQVLVHTSEGLQGLGETFWGAEAVEAYLHESVAPVLLGLADPAPERVAKLLAPYVGFGGSGAETRGNGAVDIALWDLLGKRAGLPVTALLGGPAQESLRVYNTCAGTGYIRDEGRQSSANWGLAEESHRYEDLEAFLHRPGELARSLLEEGITAMKVWPFDSAAERTGGLHVSPADIRQGMKVLEEIRGAAGDRMDILVELHGLWSVKAAVEILTALEDIEPFWVEDPLRPDGIDGYRSLRGRTSVPIATGETLAGRRAFKPLLESGAIDVALIDISWTGGLTEAHKVAALADTYGVAVAPHDCTGPVSFATTVQFIASQPNGLIAETVRAFHHSWYGLMAEGLPVPVDGWVAPTAAPGLGVALRAEHLEAAGTSRRVSRLNVSG